MSVVFKGLTRPALIRGLGVPLYPFLFMIMVVVVIAANTSDYMYFLIPVGWFLIKKMTEIDDRVFDLLYLRYRVSGHPVSNQKYDAVHYSGNTYDKVDISKLEKMMKLNHQTPIEDMIPFSTHITDKLVCTRKQDLIATWEIDGAYFECQAEDELDRLTDRLNTLIRSFEDKAVTFYTHRIRTKSKIEKNFRSLVPFANRVMNDYYDSLSQECFYKNRLFISLCYKPLTADEKLTFLFSKNKKEKEKQNKKILTESIAVMNDMTGRLDNYLEQFNATRLGVYEEKNRVFSSQLSLFQYLLTGKWQKIAITNSPFYNSLGGKDVFFGSDSGQLSAGSDARYFRIIEIKDYFQHTESGIFDALMYVPVEYIMTSSFTILRKKESTKRLDDQLDKLVIANDAAVTQQNQLIVGTDMLASGLIAFGNASFSLLVYADSPEELIKNSNMVANILQDLGLVVTYSGLSLGAAYFAQLPANYTLRPRLSMISSLNFVEMESFHNFFSGKEKNNSWGDALITLKGSGNDVYHMNYHMTREGVNDFGKNPPLAHTEILGASGGGKTVLMMAHALAAQQYGMADSFPDNRKIKKLTTVFFDKDRAGEVAIRAMGGEYFKIKSGEPTGWNPFQLAPTKRNIAFLKELVRILCTVNGGELDDHQLQLISDAVERLMQRDNRTYGISKLIPLIMEDRDGTTLKTGLKVRLNAWAKDGEFGWVFDNENETFDINEKSVFGVDGTEFLDDKVTSQVIPFYLIYKVASLADGRRLLIYMDEFHQWLVNESMQKSIYNILKTGRKLDMVLVFATQSPDELIKTPIAAAVREQCATHIYLSNPKATREDYVNGLQVSELYFDIIKNIDPLSRMHLVVKNPQRKGDKTEFAAFAKLDLGQAAKYLPILSASSDQMVIFDEIYQEGMKPEEWIDVYLNQVNKISH
ncbi:TPA: VirB3 family type IV secretion system protein [Klebsiella aerogenes]|uniref:Type IV secretion system protein VirB4 n=6 Tax=Enterobacterales TaxID=91347 RepID=A0A1I3XAW2_9GAMM|nr:MULTISPECIES: VirB3 family type IV secretion system protein [Enterobacterales]EAW3267832.1 conjugal transfer protein [Salmonella enterica]EBU6655459.1 conjugal transfer protein [Salmonella enterica subsp. enterica serovar Typhimurium]EJF7775398.1 VirB3 family type IV secretion system protein [Salmonella enterica subsp. enterica]EKU4017538.1 VirB3 family type IV secretion system protein [Morganella morganii]HBS0237566.1 VirB3 family type IV secretion system protein [Klebsiella aerogenes]